MYREVLLRYPPLFKPIPQKIMCVAIGMACAQIRPVFEIKKKP
jgi:hypothetical protein